MPVLGRFVSTLPEFWFEPLAKPFEDTGTACSAPARYVPRQMELLPPGGSCMQVDGRSDSTLPVFWLLPQAKALEDTAGVAAALFAQLSEPRQMVEWPPGGACKAVEGRSVSLFPLFWL